MATPPLLKAAPNWDDGRPARELAYVVVLLQEGHVDPKKIPPGQVVFAMASPYEQQGVTSRDIERWISECDPKDKPPWDPVACFRDKARRAMKPRPGLALPLLAIGGAAFFVGFALSRSGK